MKKVKIASIVFAALLSFSQVTAQKKNGIDEKIEKRFGITLAELGKINVSQPKEVQKVADKQKLSPDLVVEAEKLIREEADRRTKEIQNKRKEYLPKPNNNPQRIDKDILPLLSGMPEPVVSLPQAKQALKGKYEETVFFTYIEKLKLFREQLNDEARKMIPDKMKDPKKMENQAKADARKNEEAVNNNAIIQEMGGLEALKNMTPAQREALAKQMSAKVKQNPSAYTGQNTDPGKAFTQKMMTDPTYAAKFNHMNDQQKQEEYQAFLKENGFANNTTQAYRNKSLAERDRAATLMAIETRLNQIMQHSEELSKIVGASMTRTENYFQDLNERVNKQYAARVAALPLVEMGEVGHGKETYPVDVAYQITMYPIHQQNALANKEYWKRQVDMFRVVVAEYSKLMDDFWGKDNMTDELMMEKLLTPPAVLAGLCSQLIDLTEKAKTQTGTNASWQRQYDETVLHIYE